MLDESESGEVDETVSNEVAEDAQATDSEVDQTPLEAVRSAEAAVRGMQALYAKAKEELRDAAQAAASVFPKVRSSARELRAGGRRAESAVETARIALDLEDTPSDGIDGASSGEGADGPTREQLATWTSHAERIDDSLVELQKARDGAVTVAGELEAAEQGREVAVKHLQDGTAGLHESLLALTQARLAHAKAESSQAAATLAGAREASDRAQAAAQQASGLRRSAD